MNIVRVNTSTQIKTKLYMSEIKKYFDTSCIFGLSNCLLTFNTENLALICLWVFVLTTFIIILNPIKNKFAIICYNK